MTFAVFFNYLDKICSKQTDNINTRARKIRKTAKFIREHIPFINRENEVGIKILIENKKSISDGIYDLQKIQKSEDFIGVPFDFNKMSFEQKVNHLKCHGLAFEEAMEYLLIHYPELLNV